MKKEGIVERLSSSFAILSWMTPLMLITGCLPCYYAPNAQNVPLFKEKNQFNGSAAFKVGMYSIGTDIQAAASLTDHLGIMANYSYFTGKKSTLQLQEHSYDTKFRSNLIEFGMGYFHTFEDKFVAEIYSGYSSDNIKTEYDRTDTRGNSTLNYSSFFLQPAIGFYKSNIELAFSMRYRLVNYNRIELSYNIEGEMKDQLLKLKDEPLCSMLEPAITFRAGGEIVKFQFQAGISIFFDQPEYFDYDPLNINFGIIFTPKFKKGN
jgi:hypothetical protein